MQSVEKYIIKRLSVLQKLAAIILLCSLVLWGCQKPNVEKQKEVGLDVLVDYLVSPVTLTEPPDGSRRLFVADQVGQVWIIDKNGNRMSDPFIDVSSKMVNLMPQYDERGLLGLAFHPDFRVNGKFYLYYTAPPPAGGPDVETGKTGLPMTWNNLSRISEFRVAMNNPNKADMSSERVILEIKQPQMNHEGGTLAFGPDGYLYISIGDGGNKNDIGPGHVPDWYEKNAGGNGQDIEHNLLGNILRIDVNRSAEGKNYAIPSDNPFVGRVGLDEIYAFGFRNPYRFSFDMSGSRRIFASDAGQVLYEEIDVVEKGGNYGWNVKEGTSCFNAADNKNPLPSCPDKDIWGSPLIDPVIEAKNHEHPQGGEFVVIVGGYVYRGNNISDLQGKYIFGNFAHERGVPSGQIYMSNPSGPGLWSFSQVKIKNVGNDENIGHYIKGFGQDLEGEVYVLGSKQMGPTGNTGKVFKMVRMKHNKDK